MTIAEGMLAEFEQEVHATRACLERVPEDQLDFRPHAKSMSLGQLALHIAGTPAGVLGIALPDVAAAPDFSAGFEQAESKAQVLAVLDDSVATVRRELGALNDAQMLATWRLTMDDKEILALPRVAFLRSIMLNHWYHHRGQLTVYLRMLDIPVPSVYGPSADEAPAFLA